MSSFNLLAIISEFSGAPELAVRLLLSLVVGYPLVYIHHCHLKGKDPVLQHLFFIAGGLSLAIFNYGFGFLHSAICILTTWTILSFIGGTVTSVIISLIFHMGYLLIGYLATGTDTYDFTWTMPHCVLTLRLIALTMDVYDGQRPQKELSTDQQKTALQKKPSLLEIASHTYFPASFIVGPQFSMRRYQNFIHGNLYPKDAPSPVVLGFMRGFTGLIYLGVYHIGSQYIPDMYLVSDDYMNFSLWKKMFVLGIWGKLVLYKYISCWLITEGACIVSGLAYSGRSDEGEHSWKGCANVRIVLFETGTTFGQLITAFNTNTNAWVAQYIYKRLKFLNNKYLSQIGALTFLAVWHGFHSGYYATFLLEFLCMFFEKNLSVTLNKYPALVSTLQSPPLSYILYILMKSYTIVLMGYCVSAFALLKSEHYLLFYSSVYYFGHILFGGWLLYGPLLKIILRKLYGRQSSKESDVNKKSD